MAAAAALALASGPNPSNINLDEKFAQTHLINCFDSSCMVPFPNSSKKLQQNQPSNLEIEIFCIRRMPEFRKNMDFIIVGKLNLSSAQEAGTIQSVKRLPKNILILLIK